MTDNEIIKALKCCRLNTFEKCRECPAGKTYEFCSLEILGDALDLIKRQQAEIERLQTEKDALIKTYAECQLDNLKAFVKYLKKHACSYDLDNYHWFQAVDVEYLDDFIQEFVEAKYDR
jgi:hypothetical protein